ncbi:DUF1934 domain-containing protein [Butyrivibrio sp. TB]|jgi:uncharacterized beta-barrel protein YwiB (DUF1934 family)|uniref:DUF1934 domain-containing protein n=1 Tax=Butyrivibrio sp. TB TaxID=1520809 RepID=UPI0008B5DAEE|nr:DUF1934 domain-containing protein [Butyrivibrio sp. TB]SEP70989.1 protein of unknown function [Butyrivibrio sp. TB]
MERKANISVIGIHDRGEKTPEKIESNSTCTWDITDDGINVIKGDESRDESGEMVTTSFRISSSKIKMVRKGSFASVMVFEKGVDHVSTYNTPYGAMDMKVKTDILEVDGDENHLYAHVKYMLEMDGQVTSNSDIKIDIRA